MQTRWVFIGVLAGAAVIGGYKYSRRHAAVESNGYVDAAACSGCHREIWETYRRTGMGRSFGRAKDFANPGSFYHEPSDRYYTIHQKDGKYYQRRHQIGYDGRENNVVEKEIHYIIGSGSHARTFLHRTSDGKLLELPAAWYAERGGHWAMNPGYDHPNHPDFRRQVPYECVFCHAAYPDVPAGADQIGSEARFPGRAPEAIDCQRCHGPGGGHITAAQAGEEEAIRRSIVNPARLSSERQLELCMQCHLETTSARLPHAIVRFDRGVFSYRPGEPLADYVIHFDHPPGAGGDDKFEIAHQAYRLRKSKCFVKSVGRLTCTTCHNPHDAPAGEAAVGRYTAACRACHTSAHRSAENCLDCHMPKRRTDDVSHVVMTDHYIQRTKPARDLLAPLKERGETEETAYKGPVAVYYPSQLPQTAESELYLALAQVKQVANVKEGIPRLAAALERHRPENGAFYFELAEAYAHAGQIADAIRLYEEAVRRKPDFRPAWRGLGKTLSKSGRHGRAVEVLQKASQMAPQDPTVLNDLGLLYVQQGKPSDAVTLFRRAVAADPDDPDAYNNLGGALSASGDRIAAEEAHRNAIRIQPDHAAAHRNLANLLAEGRDIAQAEYHYRKAIYHNPNYASAHYDFGLALASAQRYEQARTQFEAAVRVDRGFAEAHSSLGDMLSLQGRTAPAAEHYARALSLKPDLGVAHLGLGLLLVSQGRQVDAVSHLQQAARSQDLAVRQAAQEALGGSRNPQ